MTDIAKLVLEVDASQVDAASVALDKLVVSSEKVESSEAKRAKTSKTATEALRSATAGESQLATALSKRGVSEAAVAKHLERRHQIMLTSAKMTGALALKSEAATARETSATNKLADARVRAFKGGILEQRLKEIAATEKQTAALRAQALAQQKLIDNARTQQAIQKLTQSQGVGAGRITAQTSMFAAAPSAGNVYALAGVRDPKELVKDIERVRNAQLRLRAEYDSGAISAQAYHRTVDVLEKRMNVLTEGNARHRSSFRKLTASMASFAFETTGAIYLVTSLAAALAAPALVGVALARSLEDTELGLAAILSSMGKINGESVQLPQALEISSGLMKQMLNDSIRFGIGLEALTSTLRATLAPGLAAGLTLTQIQEIATAGTIAVRTIGLDSRQTVQEIRDLVAGGIQAASSTLATSLGIKDSDILRWKQGGTIYQELTDRLKGFTQAGELSARTMTGALEALKTKFSILLNDEQGFIGLRSALLEVSDYIGVFNKETNAMEFNKTLVADVNAYWGVLKAVGRILAEIGKAAASLLPLVTPIVAFLSNGVQAIAFLINSVVDFLTVSVKQLGAMLALDFEKAERLGREYEANAATRFQDFAAGITSAQQLLETFQTTLAKPVVTGFVPDVPQALSGRVAYVSKGFIEAEAEVTGNADAAVNAAAKRWAKFIGVTQEGLKREHAMALAQFTQDEKALDLARKQRADTLGLKEERDLKTGRVISISEQEKTNIDARNKYILEKETELRLAREGELKKYNAALESLAKKDTRLAGYQKLIVELKSLEVQAGKTATTEERIVKAFAAHPENFLTVTDTMKEALVIWAQMIDAQKQVLVYSEQVTTQGNQQVASLHSQIDAAVKHNEAIGNSKKVTLEVRAAREALLATSLMQRASDIAAAQELDGPYREANLRFAEGLREQARLHKELSTELSKGSYLEAIAETDKAWKKSVDRIEGTFHKAFLTIGKRGVSMWETMTNSFREMFRTTVMEYIYAEMAKPLVLNVIASVAGVIGATGMSQAAASGGTTVATNAVGSAAGNWLGAASTMGSAFTGGVGAGVSGGFGAAGTAASGAFGVTTAGTASAIGAYVGAALPYIAAYYIGEKLGKGKEVGGLSTGEAAAIGMAIAGPVGAVIGGAAVLAFGRGPRQEGTQKLVGKFTAEGFVGDLQTEWREKGGWFRSDKSGTDVAQLTEDQQEFFNAVKSGTQAAFDSLTDVAGETARSVDHVSFLVDYSIDTAEGLAFVIDHLADRMGERLVPEIVGLQKEGENLADTAVRIRDEFILTDRVLLILGQDSAEAFGAVGLASAEMRDNLVEVAGGMGGLSSLMQNYYKDFFTSEEKLSLDTQSLTAAFDLMGESLPKSRDEFRALVEAQDLSTDAGQRMFVSLLTLAPALGQVITANDNLAKSANDAARALASQRRDLDITLMEAQGDAAGALAARREDELAALDASLRPLQLQIYAQLDLNAANEEQLALQGELTSVYDAVNSRLRDMKLLTTDAFTTAFEYAKYLRKAQNAGVYAAEEALGSPNTTFVPEKSVNENAALIAEIDKLREEIRAGQISMAQFLAESTKILRRWNGDGMPETRVV